VDDDQPTVVRLMGRPARSTAAVVVVATVLVGVAVWKPWGGGPVATAGTPSNGAVVTPSPTWTPAPTAPPRDLLIGPSGAAVQGPLDPVTYDYIDIDRQGFNVRFTVPAGWTWNGRYLSKGGVGLPDGAAIFFFGGRVQVYADPCHWAGAQSNPPTSLAVDDLVAAVAAQPLRSATTPTDRPADSLGLRNRWAGMAVELTVPDDLNLANCDRGQFRSWGPENNARSHQGPGQRDLVWAVDLSGNGVEYGGQRLIIDAASFPGTPADVMSEVEAILGSIAFGHWG
jgi:hypothetical protein